MKYISLFAGIGGFDIAMKRMGHECVFANDIDKYCKIIYDSHSNQVKLDTRSIKDVPEDEIPDHEILCGGFPCQSFSIAGRRRGFEDTRGTLFFDIARIAKYKRPRILFLENVKGLLSHNHGDTFKTIIATLTELGYDIQWQVLNSKDFGVPQNRERVFIIGHLRGTPRPKVFPFLHKNSEDSRERGLLVPLTECRSQEAKDIRREMWKTGRDYSPRRAKTFKMRNEMVMGALTANQNRECFVTDGTRVRTLTPTECERLQGFPDGWTAGVSNLQRYKMLGNAVTVNVIDDIVWRLS